VASHVGTETSEKRFDKHSRVNGKGETGIGKGLEFIASVCCYDGLEEQDKRLKAVAKEKC